MATTHPQPNAKGQQVAIHHPSIPTALETWNDPSAVASVIPGGVIPPSLNGIPFDSWAPLATAGAWANVEGQALIDEPEFKCPPDKKPAAGVVIEETDGRIWLVSPSNGFGGYKSTFPKGTVENGINLQATAIREAFEESGLQVAITGFLADSKRSSSFTRYYLARRISGSPADMGWESQAVHLVPRSNLADFLTNSNDAQLLKAIVAPKQAPIREDLLKYFTLSSEYRIVATTNAFRQAFGKWPTKVAMDAGMYEALQREIFTPLGWSMMVEKLELTPNAEGTVIAFGDDGCAFDYAEVTHCTPARECSADVWLWGIPLASGC